MKKQFMRASAVVALLAFLSQPAAAQLSPSGLGAERPSVSRAAPADGSLVVAQRVQPRAGNTAAALGEADVTNKTNAWTIGLAAGVPEGTFLHIAAEIARNLNDGYEMRVLPIVTPGATENVKDLLYLKGVDIAITNADVFEHFRTVERIPNIERRIHYITALYTSDIHLIVRPEINSVADLNGKKIGLHVRGSGSTVTGPLVMKKLGIKAEPVFVSNAVALEKMKTGEISAIVHNGGKPNPLIARFKNTGGFKLMEIPLDKFDEFYVPSVFTSQDYPNFLKPGEKVETIAVPTVLAVYNWPRTSDRLRRVSRFVDYMFDRFERFKGPGYNRLWKDVNLAANMTGWTRYWVAEDRLKKVLAANPPGFKVDEQLARQQAARAAPGDKAEQERLFQRFLEWTRQQAQASRR
jgi:TRAP transporter TAXI family solute receptor